MIICLHTCAAYSEPQQVDITLSERLPPHIVAECNLHCAYSVKSFPDYYILTLDVSGNLPVCCFRCMEIYSYPYTNYTELAICRDEKTAEKCMAEYESLVLDQYKVDLQTILTDELHLYVPEKHSDRYDCQYKFATDVVN